MTVNIKNLDQIGAKVWDGFVERHLLGTVYHHSAWHRAIEKTYGHRGMYCVVDGSAGLEAALPFVEVRNPPLKKRLVAYPYSDACDPLVETEGELEAITRKMEEHRKAGGAKSMEIRTYRLFEKAGHAEGKETPSYYDFVLNLERDTGRLFRSFHKDCVQRAIKKARTSGVEVAEGRSFDDMRDFYGLHVTTRKRLGVPVQPLRFFRNVWESLCPPGMLSVFLARVQGQAVAGVVQLKYKDTVYYKFAASDSRYLGMRPNHLIIWTMIEKAIEEGFSYLDFGRTYSGDTGLMQWKSRWGTQQKGLVYIHPFGNGKSRFNQEGNKMNLLLNALLRKMPCFAVKLSGQVFYRYLA
jgi:hypothetical protein